jgi:stress-induced morphogen
MPIGAEEIAARIRAALPDAQVEVTDTTGGGDHFSAVVVTGAFTHKSLVERHRLVYAALGELMHREIHALALTTDTPEEYKRT